VAVGSTSTEQLVQSTFLRVVPLAWLFTLVTKKKVTVYSSSEESDISIPLNDTTDESSDGQKDDDGDFVIVSFAGKTIRSARPCLRKLSFNLCQLFTLFTINKP